MSDNYNALENKIPDALGEAKRRWGEAGHVFLEDPGLPAPCLVGVVADNRMQVYGQGVTWEYAFADTDDRNVAFVRNIDDFLKNP